MWDIKCFKPVQRTDPLIDVPTSFYQKIIIQCMYKERKAKTKERFFPIYTQH